MCVLFQLSSHRFPPISISGVQAGGVLVTEEATRYFNKLLRETTKDSLVLKARVQTALADFEANVKPHIPLLTGKQERKDKKISINLADQSLVYLKLIKKGRMDLP